MHPTQSSRNVTPTIDVTAAKSPTMCRLQFPSIVVMHFFLSACNVHYFVVEEEKRGSIRSVGPKICKRLLVLHRHMHGPYRNHHRPQHCISPTSRDIIITGKHTAHVSGIIAITGKTRSQTSHYIKAV